MMAGQIRSALRVSPQLRTGSARLFSSQACLRQEIRDAYILSASRTPTAKVRSWPQFVHGAYSLTVF
jgi:acetyl-CoA C-acetyltransferase